MTHHFERILVPIDFSETSMIALDYALYIAEYLHSEITLLHVHETEGFSNPLKSLLFKSSSDQKAIDSSVEKQLMEIAEKAKNTVPQIKVLTKSGEAKVSKQITDTAEEIKADLIVMGTRGTRAGDKSIGGANSFRVVATAPCPTITVSKKRTDKGFKDIVLPIDTSRESREKVDDAIAMATHFGSAVHIAAVTSSDDDVIYNHLKKVALQVQTYIEQDDIKCTNDFFAKKNITLSTLDHARKVNADLIIIMTEQEPSGLFMGPYAQQMINQSEIPVMSIRPKEREMDFVRPY